MQDLRKWKERPAEMAEWLLGVKWEPLRLGQMLLRTTRDDGASIRYAQTFGDGWCLSEPWPRMGSETGDAGIRAASLAIINSKPVWRTPDGYDLILGRWPTDEELERHTEWTGHIGVVTPRLRSHTLEWRRDIGQDAPLYLVPLRPDGLPGILGGE